MTAATADAPLPTDAELMARAARAGTPLFKVLQDPGPLRPLLAALAVLPAVLAGPRCGLDAVDPAWGLACLDAAVGETGPLDTPGGPAAWLTGLWLAHGGDAAVPYFALSWLGATLLVWAVWQLTAAALTPRAAAFAALLTATNPATVAAAGSAAPASLSVALAVAAAWLWVRGLVEPGVRGRPAGFGPSAAAGATAGLAALVGDPATIAGPVGVAAASLALPLFGRHGGRLAAAGGFAAGVVPPVLIRRFVIEGPAAPSVGGRLSVLAVAGVALLGVWFAARGPGWLAGKARAAAGGWVGAAGAAAGAAFWATGEIGGAATLALLVGAAVAGAVAFEAACRPAVPTRVVTLLIALPAAVAVGLWVWSDDPVRTFWRAAFVAVAGVAAWGVWQTAAHDVIPAVRSRRLLIAAVLAVAAGGVWRSVRAAEIDPGRGSRQFLAALRGGGEWGAGEPAAVLLLADADDQSAVRFLARAADPRRPVTVLAPDEPLVGDAVLAALAADDTAAVAAVGGSAAAWLSSLFPGQSVPLVSAGSVRGKPVRLARFPRRN